MAIYTNRRLILSLRQPFHSNFSYISSISRSYTPSLHFRSSPLSSTSVLRKFLSSFNSSPLLHNRSFRSSFNGSVRSFATRLSESSCRNNGPPKETITLEGCDFEHWLVVVKNPDPQLTRDDIIDGYIKTLAQILGSEEEARMKIYAVSTRHYFAFGALVSEELSYKLKELPNVQWVLPDSYMDVKNKTYFGEPFINGQPVPYDPKYHEVWVRNHAESQRNKNKSSRRQRDPNSRSRSLISARDNLNQNWISETCPQNQALQTSNMQNQTSQPSSLSDPGNHQQSLISAADSSNESAQSSQMQIPSRLQNQLQNQSPPTYSQNQDTSTYAPNQAPPTYAQKQAPPTYSQNQAPPTYAQKQAPPTYSQNQAPPTYSQNQAPPTYSQIHQAPPTYSQIHQAPPTYIQNQAPQPSLIQNHSMPWTPPPPQHSGTMDPNSQGWGGQSHSWTPPGGSKNQAQHPSHMTNQTPPSSSASNPYDPAKNVHSQSWETGTRYQSYPPQPPSPNNYFSYNNMPTSAPASNTPYQGQSWGPASEYQSQSPHPQISNNYSHDNVPPSARDMPSQMQNTNSHRGSMPSHIQENEYPFRDIPHHAQSGNSTNGYPSQSLQQQQYQDSHGTYRDMQSSTSIVTPQSAQNFQNANVVPPTPARDMSSHMWNPNPPRWDVPAEVQQNGYPRNIPHHVQNGGVHTGYPPHTFQNQHYENKNSSSNLQDTNATASPQKWNYQSITPSTQNSVFPNMPMSHGVQSHQYQGKDMPSAMQNSELQHNMGRAAKNVDYNGGGNMPNDSSMDTVQTRDYQERDSPTEDYTCVSK